MNTNNTECDTFMYENPEQKHSAQVSPIGRKESMLSNEDELRETNCLIVFFLSHGTYHEELHAKDAILKSSEIWEPFVKCEQLKNKPKMFIFQACKGEHYSTVDGQGFPTSLLSFDNFSAKRLGSDMLLVYSSSEGNKSFRSRTTGTWFIQELCKNISAYGRRDDVISIITRIIKCVCSNYYHVNRNDIVKQMPVFISTLSKKFYLNRNKDRDLLLSIQKETEEIHEMVNEIALHIGLKTRK